jgi:hypothetical protein
MGLLKSSWPDSVRYLAVWVLLSRAIHMPASES